MHETFEGLFKLLPIATYRIDSSGRILETHRGDWSPAACNGDAGNAGRRFDEILPSCVASYIQDLLDHPEFFGVKPPLICAGENQSTEPDKPLWSRAIAVENNGTREIQVALMDLSSDSPAARYEFMPRFAANGSCSDMTGSAAQSSRLRSLGEMASGLVHEFSQPVTGIRGFAEGMLLGKQRGWSLSDEELTENLSQIVELTGRMSELIDHVRGFAHSGDMPDRIEVNLSDIVDSALMMISTQLRQRGITVRVEEPAEALFVVTNAFLLEEALLALLANARDALCDTQQPHEPQITLRLRQESSGDGGTPWAVLEVEDNGVGIPVHLLKRVQDPFFTTKGPDRGVGLGLNRARRTIELSGGAFALQSEEGRGTIARMTLPLARVAVETG